MVFCAAILGVFLLFSQTYGQLKANVENLDFWGAVMLLNVLVILGVIVAFWISVLLTDTLWTLLFLVPFTLFIFNKGLGGSAQCEVENN